MGLLYILTINTIKYEYLQLNSSYPGALSRGLE